jgi:hypothetical protein
MIIVSTICPSWIGNVRDTATVAALPGMAAARQNPKHADWQRGCIEPAAEDEDTDSRTVRLAHFLHTLHGRLGKA